MVQPNKDLSSHLLKFFRLVHQPELFRQAFLLLSLGKDGQPGGDGNAADVVHDQ